MHITACWSHVIAQNKDVVIRESGVGNRSVEYSRLAIGV